MTDTAEGGWWMSEHEGKSYCMDERAVSGTQTQRPDQGDLRAIQLLERLFCENMKVQEYMAYVRVPLLFVLACGGNLVTAKVNELHEWNRR